MKFSTQYKYEPSHNFETINEEPSMTQQADAEDSDINVIMRKYNASGMVPGVLQPGIYGDFSNVGDYKTAVERVNAANEAFMALPADVRDRFGNDPDKFIKFATDEKNLEEIRKMGLAKAVEIKEIPEVKITNLGDLIKENK